MNIQKCILALSFSVFATSCDKKNPEIPLSHQTKVVTKNLEDAKLNLSLKEKQQSKEQDSKAKITGKVSRVNFSNSTEWQAYWAGNARSDFDSCLDLLVSADLSPGDMRETLLGIGDGTSGLTLESVWNSLKTKCQSPLLEETLYRILRSRKNIDLSFFETDGADMLNSVKTERGKQIVAEKWFNALNSLDTAEFIEGVDKVYRLDPDVLSLGAFTGLLRMKETETPGASAQIFTLLSKENRLESPIGLAYCKSLIFSLPPENASHILSSYTFDNSEALEIVAKSYSKWSIIDPIAVTESLNTIPKSKTKDFAIAGMVAALKNANPELTQNWSASIESEAGKAYAESMTFVQH